MIKDFARSENDYQQCLTELEETQRYNNPLELKEAISLLEAQRYNMDGVARLLYGEQYDKALEEVNDIRSELITDLQVLKSKVD